MRMFSCKELVVFVRECWTRMWYSMSGAEKQIMSKLFRHFGMIKHDSCARDQCSVRRLSQTVHLWNIGWMLHPINSNYVELRLT